VVLAVGLQVGFPGQFSSICVTAGIISRICVQGYNPCAPCALLTIQIDAAINPGNQLRTACCSHSDRSLTPVLAAQTGNSGGPAFDEDGAPCALRPATCGLWQAC
jgi:hypothetical protein